MLEARDFVAVQSPSTYQVWKKYKNIFKEKLERALIEERNKIESEYGVIINCSVLIEDWNISLEVWKEN